MKKLLIGFILTLSLIQTSCKKENSGNSGSPIENSAEVDGIKYTVDAKNSLVNWTGSKPLGKHTGTINLKEGFVNVKGDSIVSGRFFMDMNTIVVTDLKPEDGKEDLENHLKGLGDISKKDHFFNVKKYPSSDFKLTSVEVEEGNIVLYGNLSIKGITKAVNFPADVKVTEKELTIVSKKLVLNRTYWNVNYASKRIFANLQDKFINDEIEIQVNVKAKR